MRATMNASKEVERLDIRIQRFEKVASDSVLLALVKLEATEQVRFRETE